MFKQEKRLKSVRENSLLDPPYMCFGPIDKNMFICQKWYECLKTYNDIK